MAESSREGADEGNKGVLSLARIETHIYVGYIVVALAGSRSST